MNSVKKPVQVLFDNNDYKKQTSGVVLAFFAFAFLFQEECLDKSLIVIRFSPKN